MILKNYLFILLLLLPFKSRAFGTISCEDFVSTPSEKAPPVLSPSERALNEIGARFKALDATSMVMEKKRRIESTGLRFKDFNLTSLQIARFSTDIDSLKNIFVTTMPDSLQNLKLRAQILQKMHEAQTIIDRIRLAKNDISFMHELNQSFSEINQLTDLPEDALNFMIDFDHSKTKQLLVEIYQSLKPLGTQIKIDVARIELTKKTQATTVTEKNLKLRIDMLELARRLRWTVQIGRELKEDEHFHFMVSKFTSDLMESRNELKTLNPSKQGFDEIDAEIAEVLRLLGFKPYKS